MDLTYEEKQRKRRQQKKKYFERALGIDCAWQMGSSEKRKKRWDDMFKKGSIKDAE